MTDEQIREIAEKEVATHYDEHRLAKNERYKRDVEAQAGAFRYALRILDQAGFVCVPKEPTRDAIRAGCRAVSMLTHTGAEVCYRAMLTALSQDKTK